MYTELLTPPAQRALAPAKRRILETADVLFTDEGIRVVGVDRLIHDSRVTKATFYKHYGSKDRLVLDYVRHRHEKVAERAAEWAEQPTAEAALRLFLSDTITEIDRPGFRGCSFLTAAAEFAASTHPVRVLVAAHREWFAEYLTERMRALGHPLPGDAADDLLVARDGAMSGAFAGDPIAATTSLTRTVDRIVGEAAAG